MARHRLPLDSVTDLMTEEDIARIRAQDAQHPDEQDPEVSEEDTNKIEEVVFLEETRQIGPTHPQSPALPFKPASEAPAAPAHLDSTPGKLRVRRQPKLDEGTKLALKPRGDKPLPFQQGSEAKSSPIEIASRNSVIDPTDLPSFHVPRADPTRPQAAKRLSFWPVVVLLLALFLGFGIVWILLR